MNQLKEIAITNCMCLNDTYDSYTGYEQRLRESLQLEKLIEDLSLNVTENKLSQSKRSARNLVLQRCGQTAPLNFSKCYPQSLLQNCHKIGEGVYGEVFLYRNPIGGLTVMKIIPIEGEMLVNGEKQKQYEEIISEIIIASELSNLRNNPINKTAAFNELQQIKLVQGKYPDTLLDLWDLYNESKGSENDNPEDFGEDQLYIVLELAYGGLDLEQFNFTNFCEVYHCFIQIILGLAIAEQELQFEHRDLHWGNVLIAKTVKNAKCSFNIDGTMITLPTHGVVATIIDFTLSRVTHNDCCIYNDLSQDPDLFTAEGDYQFDIYRQMQSNNRNDWEAFNPYSNLLWLHYLLVKMTTSVNLSKKKISTKDKVYFNNLIEWEKCLLNYKSSKQFVFEALLPKLKEKENKKL